MMKSIYHVYSHRLKEGLIELPWPTVTKGCFKKVMRHNEDNDQSDDDEEEDEDA